MKKRPARPRGARSSWARAGAARARTRLVVMAVAGLVAAALSAALGAWPYAPLVGWDVAAAIFSTWVWLSVGGMDASQTAAYARREDPSTAASEALALLASLASLIAVGIVLVSASKAHGAREAAMAGLAVASVALSWGLVHTLFTLRYARLYYSFGAGSGVEFNQDDPPCYADFAYLAFTIGMTFQVSDTNLKTAVIRATALRHALLSYLFGAVVLATTVNFIVTLSSS